MFALQWNIEQIVVPILVNLLSAFLIWLLSTIFREVFVLIVERKKNLIFLLTLGTWASILSQRRRRGAQ